MPSANRIPSRIADLKDLLFYPIPVRPIRKVAALVRTDSAVVIVGADGRIYTSEAHAMFYWRTERQLRKTIACLIKIGMLTEQAIRQHREQEAADKLIQDQRWAARAVLDNIEPLGIKLNKTQRDALEQFAARQVTE